LSQRKRASSARPRTERRPAVRPDRGSRRDLAWAFGLTLLAWLHRLAFLRSNRDWSWPYTIFYEGDAETFFNYARALADGQLYDNGIPFHPPGFAWVLAAVHALVGAESYFAVKAAVALIASAAIGLLYLLVKPYLGRTAALLAALLALYSFGLYVIAVAPVTEGTYQTLLLLCLLLWTRRFEHPLAAPVPEGAETRRAGLWEALLLGLLLGFLALTRAEGALVGLILGGVGLAGWLRAGHPGRNLRTLRPWALVLAGWVLIVAPWTVRNAIHLSEANQRLAGQLAEPLPTFVPLTVYGPINLALANNPQADGTFSRTFMASASHSPVLDLTDPEHLRFVLHGGAMARDWVLANPGAALRLVLRKWGLFFEAWKPGWTQWDWPGGLTGPRRPVDVFVPDSGIGWWLGPPLALLGLVLCLGTPGAPRRWALLVLLMTAVGLLATGLFFGYVRQGLLLLPLWYTLVAAALTALARRFTHLNEGWRLAPPGETDPPRRLLQTLAVLAVALLLLEAWGMKADRNYKATGTNVAGQSYLNRDEMIRLEVVPAR
jgi:4-amino-4-deoxy-L-arabinose transferase-like glycosyltransferase